jgi:MFS family permease
MEVKNWWQSIKMSCFMQIIGLGTLVTMPLIGNMSDKYGRKALLTVPMSLIIVPSGKHALFRWIPGDFL